MTRDIPLHPLRVICTFPFHRVAQAWSWLIWRLNGVSRRDPPTNDSFLFSFMLLRGREGILPTSDKGEKVGFIARAIQSCPFESS